MSLSPARPFQCLVPYTGQPSPLLEAVSRAMRQAEPDCVRALLTRLDASPVWREAASAQALALVQRLRQRRTGTSREGLVQALMQEFALSTQEGVSLMCLAEALLRIPDEATRDALIRDKVGDADWARHLGHSQSLFVNAATWGLLLTGKLMGTHGESGLSAALMRVVAKGGEPIIRKSVDVAMRMLGEQFVIGERIEQALHRARGQAAQGYRHSFDMLGEAAITEDDAQRYLQAYEHAIHAIGLSAKGMSLHEAPGISVKLSALHPRYSRAQHQRVMDELYPRLYGLAKLACTHGIGLNIDAEESERLSLSLSLLERLCHEPALQGWQGIGFVVQAYQKCAPEVIEFLIDLARRSQHRLMVRLVKGAYWDSEIKRAQVEGQTDYPVYTRKVHTDVAYLACARRLLAEPDAIYPQFATHNAHTLSAVMQFAGPHDRPGQYEFQCLHGMGEPLYDMVVPPAEKGGLGRPCRVYAPVGTHDTLLAYLVRRLLENGANSSFVHRLADQAVPAEELVSDPIAMVLQAGPEHVGLPHPALPLPARLLGPRRMNSSGLDLHNELALQALQTRLLASPPSHVQAEPLLAHTIESEATDLLMARNPGHLPDVIGHVRHVSLQDCQQACEVAISAAPSWAATAVAQRAATLNHAADLMQARMEPFIDLLVREAGKTVPNAVGEVREAIDFLRYYASQLTHDLIDGQHAPLGVVLAISPWNFPLAIFTGQVAAALAAGNVVLAKPAEQTCVIATVATALLHEVGVPREALQCLPGPGETVGAALVSNPAVQAVLFTGSTQVARLLQTQLASRLDARGRPPRLIAETGGINAMLVDSSALLEQVVQDVITSAFDSAGQRCSALRVLCLQEDIAEPTLRLLRGAMSELRLGMPDQLDTDLGPVVDEAALQGIEQHIERMRSRGCPVYQPAMALRACEALRGLGWYTPPTLIELASLSSLKQEVFGPVLHVLRYTRDDLPRILSELRAMAYGLTMGVHSRIDETIDTIVDQAQVGNIYVNRSMIGAVVGVQPFGGEGLSGTGPKAGGPLYLLRLVQAGPELALAASWQTMARQRPTHTALQALSELQAWLAQGGHGLGSAWALKRHIDWLLAHSTAHFSCTLPGPTGERNAYHLLPREGVLCLADTHGDLIYQLATVLAADAHAVCLDRPAWTPLMAQWPVSVRERITLAPDQDRASFEAVLMHGHAAQIRATSTWLAQLPGPIIPLQALPKGWCQPAGFDVCALLKERSISTNTAAAGGNASLMSLGA